MGGAGSQHLWLHDPGGPRDVVSTRVGRNKAQGILGLLPMPWWVMLGSRVSNDPLVGGVASWALWWVGPIPGGLGSWGRGPTEAGLLVSRAVSLLC